MVLKELRIKNSYTQKEVAKAIGVSLSTYRKYENKIESIGVAPITRVESLIKLYGVSAEFVLSDLIALRQNDVSSRKIGGVQ